MSIFGTSSFATRPYDDGEEDFVQWSHSIVEPKWIQNNLIEQTSVLTGKRHFTLKGDYAEFKVMVNLFKFTGTYSPKTFFQLIYGWYSSQTPLAVRMHDNGNAIQNSGSTEVKFFITGIELSSLTNVNFEDVAYVTFKSESYIDPTKSLV